MANCEKCGAQAIITQLGEEMTEPATWHHYGEVHSPYYRTPEQRAEDDRRFAQRFAQMARERETVEQAYADYMIVLREHQTRSGTCGPHCDELMLHSPGVCPYCDKYGDTLQAARQRLNIGFSDQASKDGQRPCPATVLRPYEQISQWPGNRPEAYRW